MGADLLRVDIRLDHEPDLDNANVGINEHPLSACSFYMEETI